MAKPVDIVLEVKNVDSALKKFDKLIARAELLNDKLTSAASAGAGIGKGTGGGGGGGMGGGGRRVKAPPVVKTWQDKAMNAIATSRVNFGRGGLSISPLMSQITKVFGVKAGLIGAGIAAAYEGIKMVGEAASAAAKQMTDYTEAGYRSGGKMRPGTANIGFGVGGDAGTGADMANKIADAIANNPYVAGIAGTHGIRNIPGPYGELNKGKMLEDFVRMLRKLETKDAKRVLNEIGEQRLQRYLPENMTDAEFRTTFPNRNKATDMVEKFNERLENEKRQSDANKSRYGTMPFGPLGQMKAAWDSAEFIYRKIENGIYAGIDKLMGGGKSKEEEKTKALKENTQALKENSAGRNGTAGGGTNARGAVPEAWKYRMFDEAMKSDQIKVGALVL